ncbi:CheR family methyltransferase [Xanthobacteraceae bacterium A53D]
MNAPATPGHLRADELKRICDFLYLHTGMIFGETKRYYVERRVAERFAATRTSGFSDYFGLLRADSGERERLINAFTVNETYFYREDHQLACLSRSLLPDLVAGRTPGDKIRIWSAPCSTGEEAYSIAIWLLENWRLVDAYNIEIVGSDIDTDALNAAREGLYGERSVSRLSASLIEAYFEPAPNRHIRLIEDLKESVTFTKANLVDGEGLARLGTFDIIFCRNVLIYFDDLSRRTTAENLYARLNPSGYLCLGHTESMSRISDRFLVRRFEDAIVYQRPGRGA